MDFAPPMSSGDIHGGLGGKNAWHQELQTGSG
jgi:hypothetical protein